MSVVDQYVSTLAGLRIDDSAGMDAHGRSHGKTRPIEDRVSPWALSELTLTPAAPGTVLDLAAELDLGAVTSVDLVSSILERAAEVNMLEAGWAHLDSASLDQARASDTRRAEGSRIGPLDGIPIGVKDLIDVAGQPTGCGSHHGRPEAADTDAPCIARLRAAGAIIVGKTTTHEYAFGGTTPPTRNPWGSDRIPGGSSGGSGAVVGAGWVPAAVGSDTAGSVRIPASYCGAVGFIGSRSDVPTTGVATLAWSLDTVGPLARCVQDAAMLNAVMAERDALQAIPRPSLPTSVGLPRAILDPLDPGVESAFTTVTEELRRNDVSLVDVDWPDDDVLQAVGFILMMAESAEFHRERMAESEKFDPEIAELLQMGNLISATDYIRARRVQVAIAERFEQVFERVPVVITPTLPCPPAPYGSGTFTPLSVGKTTMPLAAAHTRFPLLANVAGLPAGTVPCGLASGLPVGLQVIGAPGQDDLVLSIMAGIEKVLAETGVWQVGSTSTGDRE